MNATARSLSAVRRPAALLGALGLAALAGCASEPIVEAQWRSVDMPPGYLRGTTVMVSCETGEGVYKRLCEDRIVTELGARGALPAQLMPTAGAPPQSTSMPMPVPAPGAPMPVPAPMAAPADTLGLARASGAKAIFSMVISPSSAHVSQGVSVGIGGFGFGRGSALGVGVSAPIGGGHVTTGYSAEVRVTDVATSRLLWTARTSTAPSSDANAQLAELTKTSVDTAFRAGLF